MNTTKTILKGRFDFANQKTFDKAMKQSLHRREVYFKQDVCLKENQGFDEEKGNFTVDLTMGLLTDKTLRNSISYLENICQFAINGEVNVWIVEAGKLVNEFTVVPNNEEKESIRIYNQANVLVNSDPAKAVELFTTLLTNNDPNPFNYVKRGKAYLNLNEPEHALRDFTKAIEAYPEFAEAYTGRGRVWLSQNQIEKAIEDFNQTASFTLSYHPIFWELKLYVASYQSEMGMFEKAINTLSFFVKRKFKTTDPNFRRMSKARYQVALYNYNLGNLAEAAENLKAIESHGLVINKSTEENIKELWLQLNYSDNSFATV